jgi:zinc transport system substrate-binding protein
VQQIGRDLVDVQLMVQPGADPHTYEPKPKQMVAITKASLYE